MTNVLTDRERHQAHLSVSARTVKESSYRLDASAYCGKASITREILRQYKAHSDRLGMIAVVVQPTVFGKRFFEGSAEQGIPLYSSGELLNFEPETTSYISRRHLNRIQPLLAEPGSLLITRSGSVGRVVLVPAWLEGRAIQDDVLKVSCESQELTHYLYTYFLSPIGQPLLGDAAFGSVIQHIKVDYVRDTPVARLAPKLEQDISERIAGAISARAESRQLLIKANLLTCQCNNLDAVGNLYGSRVRGESHSLGFIARASAVRSDGDRTSEYRLDAHYYNPTAELAVANVKKCGTPVKLLRDVAQRVFMVPRFKRNYVESDHGVPFLSGKNIIQVRPTDLKYLSNLQVEEMQELMLERGWTLITCSGTIGRTCFVWKNYENYAASQHILRVIPDETEIDPGYLYAFLSSRYGYEQILRYRHGSVIDEVTDKQIEHVVVPCPSHKDQEAIGNMVREAYGKRAEAIRLEDEAQAILMNAFSTAQGVKGV